MFSPHAWGWTRVAAANNRYSHVFPTRVGVDRLRKQLLSRQQRFPHTRGGGPNQFSLFRMIRGFSPHAWGWTYPGIMIIGIHNVFPTRVGVDRQ